MPLRSYKDLLVWQKAMDLLEETYRVTATYPSEERFGLAAHTRKSSVSIPSNVAEGYSSRYPSVYERHVDIAYGSTAELETQLIAARRLGFLRDSSPPIFGLLREVECMLFSLRRRLVSRSRLG